MKRFVEGTDRGEATLFPEYLEDWINEDKPVRAIDAFVDKLSLAELGFAGMAPEATGPVRLGGVAQTGTAWASTASISSRAALRTLM
jgi:hypothetical protein